ncbi:hypothetical protein NPIL_605681 [Nephila pilipes]|uniref:Uncharacterized protein n=1 Tax=Nephila pilipes TaxID=299642 RepID=A0A8X6PSG2_NEPPI|nr:hypothetical protein NPIL_605681 [Nephila pilipes]
MLVEERTVDLRHHRKMQYFGWREETPELSTRALGSDLDASCNTIHIIQQKTSCLRTGSSLTFSSPFHFAQREKNGDLELVAPVKDHLISDVIIPPHFLKILKESKVPGMGEVKLQT